MKPEEQVNNKNYRKMKTTIRLEELGLLMFFVLAYQHFFPASWGIFFALFFVPDISFLTYIISKKTGAVTYNTFHHRTNSHRDHCRLHDEKRLANENRTDFYGTFILRQGGRLWIKILRQFRPYPPGLDWQKQTKERRRTNSH
jgi:hypothetical protein